MEDFAVEHSTEKALVVMGSVPSALKFAVFAGATQRKQDVMQLRAETETLTLTANNAGDDALCSSLCDYYLGEEHNGKIILRPAVVFGLHSAIKGQETPETAQPKDYRTAMAALGNSFGTRKRQKALVDAEKSKVDARDLKKSRHSLAAEVEAKEFAVPSLPQEEPQRHLPPHDRTTTVVADIYPIEKLAPANLLSKIAISESPFAFVDHCLKTYPTKVPLISLLHWMLKFRDLRPNALNDEFAYKKALGVIPKALSDYLLENFCEKSEDEQYTRTDFNKDRLLSYAYVVALTICDFTLDLNALSATLKLTDAKARKIALAVGGKIKAGKEKPQPVVTLKLVAPLTFPVPRKFKKQ